ncbi:serine/threonine-protein phosphatase 4 regulatory subunit 4 isoform X3 [Amia ocellicauda]|uniref:serine/threonine-protein phosphatase 4 regulatory subunit 4 isoform X3 n=1 Tax=Amia ocellicauda TaxID=2972642 RepID=UPI003463A092
MTLNPAGLFGQIDDLQDLAIIERPVRRSLKTAEEIEKLTVDEDLNDVERAVYLLSSGQDIQRASVVINLPNLVRQNPAETFRRVVPKVREVLHVAGVEMQLAAAGSFLTILQDDLILIQTHTHSILQIILLNLDHRDAAVVSNAWLETLLSAIDALPKETIRQEILNPLVSKAQLSQSLQSRLASCRILGKVAGKFESQIVKKDLLPLVRSLCQDVEYEVRSCMCRQLENIARGIGPDHTKAVVLPELMELARDEGSTVRLAAFDTIVNLLEMFDSDDRTRIIFPLVKAFCEKCFKADDAVLASLSYQYGKLCHGLSGSFTEEQRVWFLEFFKKLCILGIHHENGHCENQAYPLELEKKYESVRKNCAYNFPAMVLFADPKCFLSELYSTFSSLCHDPEISVRRTSASGFHEVVQLLGPNVHYIHKELIALLQDDSLEVLDALMNNLQETLELATSRGEGAASENKVNIPDLIQALTAAEQKAATSLKWRIHEKVLQRYSCLPRVISGDQIYFRFLQRMFTITTTNNVLPVQRESARTLCVFLRYNRKQEQRQEIISKLVEQLGQGRSYWNRLRYLDLCEIAMEIFSKSYFCKYFLIPALELVNDPVANVRYKLCHMLPKLKSTIKLPSDKHLLQQLEFCVRKLLCREKDKDVMAIVRKTVLELDKMDITEPYQKRHEKDLLDQKKEKEENLLLEMEQLERQQSEGKLTNEKHSDKKRRDSKPGLSVPKNMSGSTSGATVSTPAGKEIKKAKLARSRSLSSHPTTPKMVNSDKTIKVKESGNGPRSGKSALLPINDDIIRSHHFSAVSSSSSSVPVLIRSNTISTVEHRSNSSKDTQSRKLTMQRKSSSFGMQAGRE